MIIVKLYLVRHGRTEWNVNRMIQGRVDVSLNDLGVKDAKNNARRLKDITFDICYCSPLKRARETAEIIIGNKCDIIVDDLITERDVGRLEGTPVNNGKAKYFWDFNMNFDEDGVESSRDLLARANEFLEFLKEKYDKETILIVSHSGTIKALHYNIVGYDDNTNFDEFICKHDDILKYEI